MPMRKAGGWRVAVSSVDGGVVEKKIRLKEAAKRAKPVRSKS